MQSIGFDRIGHLIFEPAARQPSYQRQQKPAGHRHDQRAQRIERHLRRETLFRCKIEQNLMRPLRAIGVRPTNTPDMAPITSPARPSPLSRARTKVRIQWGKKRSNLSVGKAAMGTPMGGK